MKIYLASPFFDDMDRANALEATRILRNKGLEVYLPLEHKIDNAWGYSNPEWGKLVFEADKQAVDECDVLVCLSYGRFSSAGTNWEVGYAYGIKKKIVVVEMPKVVLMSLMTMNGCWAVVKDLNGLKKYDFETMPKEMDYEMEQK